MKLRATPESSMELPAPVVKLNSTRTPGGTGPREGNARAGAPPDARANADCSSVDAWARTRRKFGPSNSNVNSCTPTPNITRKLPANYTSWGPQRPLDREIRKIHGDCSSCDPGHHLIGKRKFLVEPDTRNCMQLASRPNSGRSASGLRGGWVLLGNSVFGVARVRGNFRPQSRIRSVRRAHGSAGTSTAGTAKPC
jgi:hypothetical protein